MNDIEILKRKHRERLIGLSFRSVFHRSPGAQEAERYANRLLEGLPLLQILQEMRDGVSEDAAQTVDQITPARSEDDNSVINDLLSLHDEHFIDAIYQRFLGRRADADGKKFFGNHLANGGNRLQTALDLAKSAEGQQYRLIATAAANDLANEEGTNLSFAANVFVRRFKALATVN